MCNPEKTMENEKQEMVRIIIIFSKLYLKSYYVNLNRFIFVGSCLLLR